MPARMASATQKPMTGMFRLTGIFMQTGDLGDSRRGAQGLIRRFHGVVVEAVCIPAGLLGMIHRLVAYADRAPSQVSMGPAPDGAACDRNLLWVVRREDGFLGCVNFD